MIADAEATRTATTERSVADARRQATVDQILVSAMRLVMDRGLDVTMDEIAEAVGVARRTLFRHFGSRERLLAGAYDAAIQRYGEQLPVFEPDWRSWLRSLCAAAHRMQAAYGPGYWQLTGRADLPDEIAAVEHRRRARRAQAMNRIARKLWTEAGGEGAMPERVRAAVGAHLSPRFTAAVTVDVGQTWHVAAELADAAITAAVEAAVADQRGA